MIRRCAIVGALTAAVLLAAPASTLAGDAYLKLGLTFKPDVGDFADRWMIHVGSDWGVSEMVFVGLEFQGAYRSGTGYTIVPANVMVNCLWKSETEEIRPYAGGGVGMVSAYMKTHFFGDTEHEWEYEAGMQLMGGVEFNRKWVVELRGQRVLVEHAEFAWSFLGGIRW